MLGQVRWLMPERRGGPLFCGVRLMPGCRGNRSAADRPERAERKIRAGAVPDRSRFAEFAAVAGVAAGWFKPKRVVGVYVEGPRQGPAVEVIDRGNDYERCSYEIIS
jgi:hypothetical protein